VAALLSSLLTSWRFKMARPYLQGDVLDIGCGWNPIVTQAPTSLASYVGIEDQHVAAKLHQRFPQHHFLSVDLEDDSFDLGRQFDVILMLAVIEHIYNQKHLMQKVLAHLKPEGRIVITTPTPFGNDVVHRLGAAMGLFSKQAAEDHVVIYNGHRFKILAREFGLEIERYCRFELSCNQLVVFRKPALVAPEADSSTGSRT
jgi:2-polyprenyl-3-methyl-5-hydroxy-6-metoxy-1,4-benzoquinol methylase